jgi:hypothetical protein
LLWVLPVGLALWANLHGGFVIGLLLIGIHLAGEVLEGVADRLGKGEAWGAIWAQRKRSLLTLASVLAVSAVAVSLNPYGPRLLGYPLQTLSIGTLQTSINEWQSPDFHSVDSLPFLVLLLGAMLMLAISPRPKAGREIVLFATLAGLGLVARRNIALFALGVAPLLAQHAWAILASLELGRRFESKPVRAGVARVVNLIVLALLVVAAAGKMIEPLSTARNQQALQEQQPLGALAALKAAQLPGPLFNSYTWGGYLIWDVWPAYLTFVDGRTDLFADGVLTEYLTVWNAGDGWEQILRAYGIRLALIEPEAPLADELMSAGWVLVYSDQQAVLFAAPSPQGEG